MSRRSSLQLGQLALAEGVIKDTKEISDMVRPLPLIVADSARPSTSSHLTRGSRSTVGTVRRSESMDSISWMNTPCATPYNRTGIAGTSSVKSRPGGFSAGGTDKKEPVVKNLKPPDKKDKKAVNEIFMNICEYLERNEYQFGRQMKNAGDMSNLEYHLMTKFTFQLLMGKHFLADVKNVDLPKKFLEISVQMKYPGQLNKAILEQPNVPHQLPTALAFLAWLTCVAERSLTPPSDTPSLTELNDPNKYLRNVAQEGVLNLFSQHTKGPVGTAAIQEELQHYRRNIMEVYGFGENVTKEELMLTLNEKREELKRLNEVPDPRKEHLLTIEKNNKRIEANRKKEEEMLEFYDKIADVEKMQARRAALREKLATVEDTFDSVTHQISKQKMTKLEETQILMEIEDFMKQRHTAEKVMSGMLLQQQKSEQHLNNLNTRFFETCTRLSICDVFNDLLQRLELLKMLANMERIPKNPFTPAGLKHWLKTEFKIRKNTQQTLSELDLLMKKRFEAALSRNKEVEKAEDASLQVEKELELEVENAGQHLQHLLRQTDKELKAIVDGIESITEEIKESATLLEYGDDKIAEFDLKLSKLSQRKHEKSSELRKWTDKAETLKNQVIELELYCKEELAKRVCYHSHRYNQMMKMFSSVTPEAGSDLNLNLVKKEEEE